MAVDDLYNYTCYVLKIVDNVGFEVLCVIFDNNKINCNMFEKTADDNTLHNQVLSPVNQSMPLFLYLIQLV